MRGLRGSRRLPIGPAPRRTDGLSPGDKQVPWVSSVRPASVWLRHSASALTTLSNLFQSVRVAALEVGRSTLLLLFRWTWKPSFRGLARSAAMEAWKSTWYEAIGKSAVNA